MKARCIAAIILLLASSRELQAQNDKAGAETTFDGATASMERRLEESIRELNELREQMAAERLPLSRELSELEAELVKVRLEYQQAARLLDSRTLDLANLNSEIRELQDERSYLANLLSEYVRNFESRLHIAETQRYSEPLEAAKLAPENGNLSAQEIFERQAALVSVSLERLHDALGGTRFDGTAVDASGLVRPGTFVLVGPSAIFRSGDGEQIGTAEQRLGSLEPAVIGFGSTPDARAAAEVIGSGSGRFPLDVTLGNAHKIEATRETLLEHVQKGGPVMVPILALAGVALLVALYKWMRLVRVRKPPENQVRALLNAVGRHDKEGVRRAARAIQGPAGAMLGAGVENLEEPRELIEEVMYETVLSTRLRLQSQLSFIALTASSAPLLGLLGTVTGIMNTFTLMTVFGSGDIKTLSSGISEALITTEYGLYVAIPSLLLYAFLSRKSRGVIDHMEKVAVAFVNQVSKSRLRRGVAPGNGADSASGEPEEHEPEATERTFLPVMERFGRAGPRARPPSAGDTEALRGEREVVAGGRRSPAESDG
ncbi:MAG: MotA/TolQ/ExbB proton channel family protein [Planctomycetota bacterium]